MSCSRFCRFRFFFSGWWIKQTLNVFFCKGLLLFYFISKCLLIEISVKNMIPTMKMRNQNISIPTIIGWGFWRWIFLKVKISIISLKFKKSLRFHFNTFKIEILSQRNEIPRWTLKHLDLFPIRTPVQSDIVIYTKFYKFQIMYAWTISGYPERCHNHCF